MFKYAPGFRLHHSKLLDAIVAPDALNKMRYLGYSLRELPKTH
jgi:hypothetical protein